MAEKRQKMAEIDWQGAFEMVRPYLVRISTPTGFGTGFLFSRSSKLCGVATAAHVVNYAEWWEQPIRVEHYDSGKTEMLHRDERAILLDESSDSAAIVIPKGLLPLPTDTLPLIPEGNFIRVGNEIGWVGFPAISAPNLCFFHGRTSCWVEPEGAYLVDGVAINGVSGGPAFFLAGSTPMIIGVVSAYIPNRQSGDVLPGLCVVRDLKHLQGVVRRLQSLDEAKRQEEASKAAAPPTSPSGPGLGPNSGLKRTPDGAA